MEHYEKYVLSHWKRLSSTFNYQNWMPIHFCPINSMLINVEGDVVRCSINCYANAPSRAPYDWISGGIGENTLSTHAACFPTTNVKHRQQIHDTHELNNSNDRHGDIVRSSSTNGFGSACVIWIELFLKNKTWLDNKNDFVIIESDTLNGCYHGNLHISRVGAIAQCPKILGF